MDSSLLRLGYAQYSSVLSMLAKRLKYGRYVVWFNRIYISFFPLFLSEFVGCSGFFLSRCQSRKLTLVVFFLLSLLGTDKFYSICWSVRPFIHFKVVLRRFTALMFTSLYLPMTLGFNCDGCELSNSIVTVNLPINRYFRVAGSRSPGDMALSRAWSPPLSTIHFILFHQQPFYNPGRLSSIILSSL
jgi:hypothetical protein